MHDIVCQGGPTPTTYDLTNDLGFIRYVVALLANFHNVWWSLSNEWSQVACK